MKVLIFTEKKIGSGHYHAALALKEIFMRDYGHVAEVKIMEGLRSIHPLLEWTVVHFYFMLLRLCPRLWGVAYRKAQSPPLFQKYGFAYKLSALIAKERPDMVLCTHPACMAALSYLKQSKKTGKHSFRLSYVATDYGLHPFCIHPAVDDYFVSHSSLRTELVEQFHIPEHKIHDYGIPLLSKYERNDSTSAFEQMVKTAQKNAAAPHVLLMGGGKGVGPMAKIVRTLLPHIPPLRLTVVCGQNKKLYQEMSKYSREGLEVLQYVHNMKRFMESADVVLTKPGGVTITEVLACGKPLLLFDPIPGQEDANRIYVQQEQLGDCLDKLEELPDKLYQLTDIEHKVSWRSKMRVSHPANSAPKIVHLLMQK